MRTSASRASPRNRNRCCRPWLDPGRQFRVPHAKITACDLSAARPLLFCCLCAARHRLLVRRIRRRRCRHPRSPGRALRQPSGGDDRAAAGRHRRRGRHAAPADGYRGAVLLLAGHYRVAGHLLIRASGVVLAGSKKAPSWWRPHGPAHAHRDRQLQRPGDRCRGAGRRRDGAGRRTLLTLENLGSLKVGDRVVIVRPRPSNGSPRSICAACRALTPTSASDWAPGSRNLSGTARSRRSSRAHTGYGGRAHHHGARTALRRRHRGARGVQPAGRPHRPRRPGPGERLRPGQSARRRPLLDGGRRSIAWRTPW